MLLFPCSAHAKLFLGDQDSFHVNHIYNDADTYSVVAAASEVLGECADTVIKWPELAKTREGVRGRREGG